MSVNTEAEPDVQRVAVLQSNYIPWKGYFDIIRRVDLFVFYDDVQYTKNDWRNRNRIKTPQGSMWLTIPCGTDLSRKVDEVTLRDHQWQKKHWKSIEASYAKSPYFGLYREALRDFYLRKEWSSLSELNQFLIELISREFLGFKTKFARSSSYPLHGASSERLQSLVVQTGARQYLSGPSAQSYLDEASFSRAGIEVQWMKYDYPEYPQLYPPFEHTVSVLDLLFCTGGEAEHYLGELH